MEEAVSEKKAKCKQFQWGTVLQHGQSHRDKEERNTKWFAWGLGQEKEAAVIRSKQASEVFSCGLTNLSP